jgi:hypothetical protein
VTAFRVVTLELPVTFTRTRYLVPQVRPPMVTSVCVVETMIGAAPAAPPASATTTATRPLSVVHLRNAFGIQVDGEVHSCYRLRTEVVGGGRPIPSGGAAPQIESPQNGHLDLLVVVNCHARPSICQKWPCCSENPQMTGVSPWLAASFCEISLALASSSVASYFASPRTRHVSCR